MCRTLWLMPQQNQLGAFRLRHLRPIQCPVRGIACAERGFGIALSGEGDQEVGTAVSITDEAFALCKAGDVIVKVDPCCYRPMARTPGRPTTLRKLIAEMIDAGYQAATREGLIEATSFQADKQNE